MFNKKLIKLLVLLQVLNVCMCQEVDFRISYILTVLNPDMSDTDIEVLASNRTSWSQEIDKLTYDDWSNNCEIAGLYLEYLSDEIVINNDNNSFVTYQRIDALLGCKTDCDFDYLLSSESNFTSDGSLNFVLNVIEYLPPDAASQCNDFFPDLSGVFDNVTASDCLNDINKVAFLSDSELDTLSENDSLALAAKLSNSNKKLNPSMTLSLGLNIPDTQPIDNLTSIASSVPLDCISQTSPQTLSSMYTKMDTDNMNSFRKGFIAGQIQSSNDTSAVANLLNNSADQNLISSFGVSFLNNLTLNVSTIPLKNLPTSYLQDYARNLLSNVSLANITDLNMLARALPDFTKDDLATIPANQTMSTVLNILNSSSTNKYTLTSVQRNALIDLLSNTTVNVSSLSVSDAKTLASLLILASEDMLRAINGTAFFRTVIDEISQMRASLCCMYPRYARKLFASYAVKFLFNSTSLSQDDLNKLGPCLSSVLSSSYLANMNASVFVEYYRTLNNLFQPDATDMQIVMNLISSYVYNYTNNKTMQDTLLFTKLNNLALFYPFNSSIAKNISTAKWQKSGGSLYSKLKSSYDTTDASNQLCQMGLNQTDIDMINSLLESYQNTFQMNYFGSNSRRRRRAVTQITCSDINKLSAGVTSLTVSQIQLIAPKEFFSCRAVLGLSSNYWSASQLTALATIAKSYYITMPNITGVEMAQLNTIMLGFNETDLANLIINTTVAVNTLGSLNRWTSSQLNSLKTPLVTYYNKSNITSNFLISMGNLLCLLSSSQIDNISQNTFSLIVTTIAKINLLCPNMDLWYSRAKGTTTYAGLVNSTSKLTELGSIIAGVTIIDLNMILPKYISSISVNALKFMPTVTVNQISRSQLAGLTFSQIAALQSSPNYASFSSNITSALQKLSLASTSALVVSTSPSINNTNNSTNQTQSAVTQIMIYNSSNLTASNMTTIQMITNNNNTAMIPVTSAQLVASNMTTIQMITNNNNTAMIPVTSAQLVTTTCVQVKVCTNTCLKTFNYSIFQDPNYLTYLNQTLMAYVKLMVAPLVNSTNITGTIYNTSDQFRVYMETIYNKNLFDLLSNQSYWSNLIGTLATVNMSDIVNSTSSSTPTSNSLFYSLMLNITRTIMNKINSSIFNACTSNSDCCNCTIVCHADTTVMTTTMRTTTTVGKPPAPQSAPVNLFASLDPRLCFVLSNIYPSYSPNQVAALASNRSLWGPIFDSYSKWTYICFAAIQYFMYLEDQIVLYNDNNTWVTVDRLKPIVACKQDCNFVRLLSINNTLFSLNVTGFIQSMVTSMPPDASKQCRKAFPLLEAQVKNISASNLINNLAQISFMTPNQLSSFSPNDAVKIASALNNNTNSQTLSPAMARSLGNNIPATQSLDNIATIASAVPLSCFNNTSPNTLVTLIVKMDLNNMDPFRKGFIAAKISSSNSSSTITNLLQSTSDPTIINSIPSYLFKTLSINISNIPATNLPTAYLKSYARTQLAATGLASITDLNTLSKILPGITKSDLTSVSNDYKVNTIVNILNASLTYNVLTTSNQRSALLNSLISALANSSNSTNSSVYLASLTTTQLGVLYPLFIEASDSILSGFNKLASFSTVISNVAALKTTQCCAYLRSGRSLFTSYAIPYLFSYSSLALSDLYQLGPCLVSTLPVSYLQSLSTSVFGSYFPTLGSALQPDANQTAAIQTLIMQLATNYTSQDTYVFSTLSDLALFYNFSSTLANNISLWTTNGASLMTIMRGARDPTDSSIKSCQIGLTNTDSYSSLISSYGSTFVGKYISSLTSRKKRATITSLTCSQLNDISTSLNSLTTAQLAAISLSDFYSCQTLLGLSTNLWSANQLATLASLAKSYYGMGSNISDSNIAALNSIMQGFNSSDLRNLSFTSATSISALGTLNGWSTTQLTDLATPLTKYVATVLSGTITSDFMTAAGNLMCSLTSDQINSISISIFQTSVSSLAKISLLCPNIATWYNYTKYSGQYSSLTSSSSALTELGAIISGITTADMALVSSDMVSSISSNALQYMPADTINSMSSTQLSGLSATQVVALQSSPNYSSFSSSVKSGLTSMSTSGTISDSGTTTTTTTASRSHASLIKFNPFILFNICVLSVLLF